MSPLPSKSLIWSHEPITSSPEIVAIGNFHQLPDATAWDLWPVSAIPTRGLLTLFAVAVANQCLTVCRLQFLTPAALAIRPKAFSPVL